MSETTLNCTAAGGEAVIETNVSKFHGNLTRGGSYILDQYGAVVAAGRKENTQNRIRIQEQRVCKLSSSVTRSSGLHEFDLL